MLLHTGALQLWCDATVSQTPGTRPQIASWSRQAVPVQKWNVLPHMAVQDKCGATAAAVSKHVLLQGLRL